MGKLQPQLQPETTQAAPRKGNGLVIGVVLTDQLSNTDSPLNALVRRLPEVRSLQDTPPPLLAQIPLARRATAEEITRMAELYAGGLDAKAIASKLGLHRTTVSQHLTRAGVALRRMGIPAERLAEAIRLYGDGWSTAQLGERYGCSPETVRRTLKRAGVQIRRRRGWRY